MERDALRAEPDLHDGQLRSPRIVQADPPARRHARPDGESEGRDHRAPDQGQLHGGPVGARVLHLDPRRPQGPRRHGAPHGRLGLPDAAARRRLAGRDHPRGGLRHRGPHRAAAARPRGPQPEPLGRARRRSDIHKPLASGKPGQDGARSRRATRSRSRACASSHDELDEHARRLRRSRCARCSSAAASSACAGPATAPSSPPARCARSATRSASSPRSRSASRARS